ncbi:acyl-CoA N-acyltransferase [Pluteus cervinus]|uniref:Acyl-CoA N-acyltransferase n=1 Tax=Pluteus cervinus TaxID=181527 RepID=A0ACD3A950_9AGAR|nr:acyl-CoA N-acyltransferase [Pluteus cervinus]
MTLTTHTSTVARSSSQARLRHFRANDLQAVRDLFRTAVDTGKGSARRDMLKRQRFDTTNLLFYSLIVGGGFHWFWAPIMPVSSSLPLAIGTMGGLLAIFAIAAFAYRRTMVSNIYTRFSDQSLASSDLQDLIGHYQFKSINAPGDNHGEIELGSDDARGFWVVELEGEVVGCAGLDLHKNQPTHGDLRRMAVSPDHRRYGIGKLLMNKIMDRAREYKLESVSLSTPVYQIPARRLYESYDFVEERRWVDREGLCAVSVLYYRCEL